ncbi:SDR family oxidoreductase [Pseudomonas sp. CBC3]|uniref:SDR family oxidoreductase n=1 Tax=Pseudomonas sp. CBC3 TaxID=3123318 RepID=UPI0030E90948
MTNRDQTAVICGGTAGVGRATAHALAQAGFRVAVIARGEQGLADTRQALEAAGATVLTIAADVADAEAIDRAAERIEAELGPIELWINAAMATVFAPVEKITAAEYKRVTEVTYLGFVHGTLAALRHMQPRNRGTIVQVGSALSYRAIPLQSAYCAAKFAIRGFTDSLRCELIHTKSKIRLTMVQLPAHNTPQFDWSRNKMRKRPQPVPPIHTPEVAARAILRAATDAPRELWLGRASFQAIIGNMFMPGLLDRMMAKQAWSGQMTDEPANPAQPDNLFEPVEDLHRIDGRFGGRVQGHAVALSSETVGKLAVAGLAAVTVGAVALVASIASGRSRR